MFEHWEAEHGALFRELATFTNLPDLAFELTTHRFTARAKCAIEELCPTPAWNTSSD